MLAAAEWPKAIERDSLARRESKQHGEQSTRGGCTTQLIVAAHCVSLECITNNTDLMCRISMAILTHLLGKSMARVLEAHGAAIVSLTRSAKEFPIFITILGGVKSGLIGSK